MQAEMTALNSLVSRSQSEIGIRQSSGPIVQRLGHQIFDLVTRVRFPLGSPLDRSETSPARKGPSAHAGGPCALWANIYAGFRVVRTLGRRQSWQLAAPVFGLLGPEIGPSSLCFSEVWQLDPLSCQLFGGCATMSYDNASLGSSIRPRSTKASLSKTQVVRWVRRQRWQGPGVIAVEKGRWRRDQFAATVGAKPRSFRCSSHSIGNVPVRTVSDKPLGSRPSRMARTMSGAR